MFEGKMSRSALDTAMNLEEMRRSCGLSAYRLAQLAGVDVNLVREAEWYDGLPIATAQAEKLCKVLSDHHGRRVRPRDIRDLKLC